MARIPPRWRSLDRAEGPWTPPPIGHNQGPPLEAPGGGWARHCWRQAHKKAWRPPPVEVVRRRAARAAELGLSYHDYTAILLDRGGQPKALVFTLGALVATRNGRVRTSAEGRVQLLPGVVETLARLRDCRLLVIMGGAVVGDEAERLAGQLNGQLNVACGGVILDHRAGALGPGLLFDLLAAYGLTAGAAVMIGVNESERACAEAARLARFIWAPGYFGR